MRGRVRARRTKMVAAVAAVLMFAATACSTDESAVDAQGNVDLSKVTLNVGEFGPYVQAIYEASGALDDVAYKINWVDGISEAQPLFSGIKAGAIDIGIMGDIPVTTGIASGAKFKIVNAGLKVSDADKVDPGSALVVVAPKNSDINGPADLKGKTLVTTQGSAVEYLAYLYAKSGGVAWDDIKKKYLTADKALTAFTAGDVQVWASYPPGTQKVLADGSAKLLTAATGTGNLLAGSQLQWVAADDALADPAKKAAIKDFISRQGKVNEWGKANVDKLPEISAKALNLPAGQVSSTWTYTIFDQLPLDEKTIESYQQTADNLYDAGIVPHQVEVKPYFSTEFADLVTPVTEVPGTGGN